MMNQIPGSMLIQFNIANDWDTFQAGYGKKKNNWKIEKGIYIKTNTESQKQKC